MTADRPTGAWLLTQERVCQIIPLDDLREHDDGMRCWCSPSEMPDLGVIVHNAMDGREEFERGERLPS